ncbi:MAG TPA: hypothetical protein VJ549_02170 [Geothrix sp.]|nr:hypothetical protein [Geothrix sp.]
MPHARLPIPYRPALLAALLLAGLAQLGCGHGSSGTGTGVEPPPPFTGSGPAWYGYGRDAQHSAQTSVAAQPLTRIHWQMPVDLHPQYSTGELLIHYGSMVITPTNTAIVPVKTGATDGFRVEARNGASGALLWQADSDYVLPQHGWVPSYGPALTASNRLYFAGSGGKLFFRDAPDSAQGSVQSAVFYGSGEYAAAKATYDAAVKVTTPLTADGQGNVFFGFQVTGPTPANLASGLARLGADGQGTWISAASAAGDAAMSQVVMNCAPALSNDQHTVYTALSDGAKGYLVALDSTTLQPTAKVALTDPATGLPSLLDDDGSASPTVTPDGDVYYGVLESNMGQHNFRGWLLHFDAALAHAKTPGSFGWDDTASLVPASMVPSYTGTSPYLLMTKYNNYLVLGYGNGYNQVAILDPSATQGDAYSNVPVMKEVLTILGATPDDPAHPGSVHEWCINTAVVDPASKSVFVNNEDGYLYRWDLSTNTFPERIRLTGGLGEAYTPTVMGPDGHVYAINNATLFAVGR